MRTTNNKTIDCDCCGNSLVDWEGDQNRSFVKFEKYVPHKYVYRSYCLECLAKERKGLEENGFVEYESVIMEDEAPENNLLNKAHVSGQVCDHYYVPIGSYEQNGRFICTHCKAEM